MDKRHGIIVTESTELPPPETAICASCKEPVLLKDFSVKWRDKNFPPNSVCKACSRVNGRGSGNKLDLMSFRDYYDEQ